MLFIKYTKFAKFWKPPLFNTCYPFCDWHAPFVSIVADTYPTTVSPLENVSCAVPLVVYQSWISGIEPHSTSKLWYLGFLTEWINKSDERIYSMTCCSFPFSETVPAGLDKSLSDRAFITTESSVHRVWEVLPYMTAPNELYASFQALFLT